MLLSMKICLLVKVNLEMRRLNKNKKRNRMKLIKSVHLVLNWIRVLIKRYNIEEILGMCSRIYMINHTFIRIELIGLKKRLNLNRIKMNVHLDLI
jgi:hypothetical protein